MITDLKLLQVYSAMAQHATQTQQVSATNISHANEPGYKARDVESFTDYMTRQARMAAGSADMTRPTFRTGLANTPETLNGNSVNLEREVFRSAEAFGQHEMALSVYTKSLDLLRTALGRSGR